MAGTSFEILIKCVYQNYTWINPAAATFDSNAGNFNSNLLNG